MQPPYTSPNALNYLLPKGYLQIAKWNGNVVGTYADIGNVTKFEFEPTEESLEHFSSRNAVKESDAEVVVKAGYNISFSCDEISVENLRMFLKATLSGARILYANMNMNQYYAVKYTPTNDVGPSWTFEFWKCKLTPNGALSLIGDEYTSMSFTGKGLSDRANHGTSPFFTGTAATTTTTTTTTTAV